MTPKFDSWTVVLAGQWNTRIFSPPWVGKELFGDANMQVEVGLAAGGPSIRYTYRDVHLIPSDERIIIGLRSDSDEALKQAEQLSVKILDLLPHTPVVGVGVNFQFEITDAPDLIKQLFRLADQGGIAEFEQASVKKTEIVRTIELQGTTLNLKQVLAETSIDVHMNFHIAVANAAKAKEALKDKVLEYRQTALRFLSTVYSLTPILGEANVESA